MFGCKMNKLVFGLPTTLEMCPEEPDQGSMIGKNDRSKIK